ncbi:glycosyltransferase family 1 protein [Saccharopolyspora rhizosphaerae]|uniref:Glycosyltransferase family 1 protein n=1 Tax=Saccharopolyspora rhizosphaerae TaxID=2492662 RepID=A0A426JM14_9PSEU|nr:glycosyltransferase [Saccharopolyspora rhizosphaerae]RRO14201.1 glycosyltransferase family 1 protein [Saccharopolyspora rhizosphaerae]
MRIDMVSEHASPLAALGGADAGGQNVQVAELATGLARRGHDVVVHTRRDSPTLPARVRTGEGFTVHHVTAGPAEPIPKDDLLPHVDAFAAQLAETWAGAPPDLVHAHFWMSGLAAQLGAARLDVPVVQTFHALGRVKRREQGAKDTSPPQRVELEAQIACGADRVIATCTDEVGELAEMGVPPERTAILPCGIDLDRFLPAAPRRPRSGPARVLSIGRLVERKGVDVMIRAMRDIPDAQLLIAGGPPESEWADDPEVNRLQAVARQAGVAERTAFLGQVPHDEAPDLYRSVDVVASVPWYEPFGTVPLEAMACGVPVVVSAVGGHLDTVVDRRTGLHVPPHDPAALARAVRELLEGPGLRAELGTAGAHRVRSRYGWDRLVAEAEDIYHQVRSARAERAAVAAAPGGEAP